MNIDIGSNDTIVKMMNYMKPSINKVMNDSSDSQTEEASNSKNPLKRMASTQDLEGEILTPIKKFRDNKILEVDYIGSPREIRRLRADILEARNTIMNLENRIGQMHSLQKEMRLLFDKETHDLQKQCEYDKKTILELENQLQTIRKREKDLKEKLMNVSNKQDLLKISADQKIEKLEKKLNDSTTNYKAQEGQENSEIGHLKRKVMELKNQLEMAKEDAEKHQRLYEQLQKEMSGRTSLVAELDIKNKENQKLKLQLKEYEYVRENYLEYQEQAKTQARKLSRFIEIERENEKLKEENARIKDEIKNKLVLEEETYDLKKRLMKYKEQESTFANVQMQLVQTEGYLNEWKAISRGIVEVTNVNDTVLPHLVRSAVERLQQQELSLTDEKISLQSQVNTALHEAKVAKEELQKTQKLLTKLSATDDQKKNLIHRMQKKLLLVIRERDSYRSLLDSYEKDLTMCANTTGIGSQAANQILSLKERVENLEKTVTGYRDMVAKLEGDLQKYEREAPEVPTVKVEQITRLQKEIDNLKQENERFRERKDQLEIQLEEYLVGNDSLRGGNVYHLANNPLAQCVAQREAEVEKLQKEVDRLKQKVKHMEEGIESSKLADITLSTKEVQMLKEEIKNLELQSQHLKDYFKNAMQEFRDVVYMLLGYKIDKSSKSLYKLTNIYAESMEDVLCFQLNKNGHLDLLETDFSSRLDELIKLHLKHQNSIPNFLSSLTLDLFSNRTMITEPLEINDDDDDDDDDDEEDDDDMDDE